MDILRFFGVSRGDAADGARPLAYLARTAVKSLLRLAASHCPVPSLRLALWRATGVRIGRGAAVNMDVLFLDGFEDGLVVLEDEVSVAPRVSFVAESHPNNSPLLDLGLAKKAPIRVGRGAWIGVGAVLLPGVRVGEMAVVGAGAVVSRDVPDRSVAAGVPARIIGKIPDAPPEA